MSKINKVKMLKNTVSSLDINQLYKLQEYVSVSQDFFNQLDLLLVQYIGSDDKESIYIFYNQFINLYDSMKKDLKLK